MTMTRRNFVQATSIATGLAAMGSLTPLLRAASGQADKPLRILILGGTGFIGPHIVQRAIDRGHTVTLFNRGNRNEQLFPDLEERIGDRTEEGGLDALNDGEWDAVIDTWPSVPRYVREAGILLRDRVKQYLFVSTISVYASHAKIGIDETEPVGVLPDPTVEEVTGQTYGPLKALCEQTALDLYPGGATVVRPGLIVGPRDPTDRFTYWPLRVRDGGAVLAPGSPSDRTQIIDARDLASFMIHTLETKAVGTYNATGVPMAIGDVLFTCKEVTDSDAEFRWGDADFLAAQQVSPWGDMPAWVPPVGDYAGFGSVNVGKAVSAGLTFRPLARTIDDTLKWYDKEPEERRARVRAGIAREREKEVLAALANHQSAIE